MSAKKLFIILSVVGSVASILGFILPVWIMGPDIYELVRFGRKVTRPLVMDASIKYEYDQSTKAAWEKIWSFMLPVCVRDPSRQCPKGCQLEVPPSVSEDAQAVAKFFLMPQYSKERRTYSFSGYGYYTELLRHGDERIQLEWVITIPPTKPITVKEFEEGALIEITAIQIGQGTTLDFNFNIKIDIHGVEEQRPDVYYQGVRVAKLTIPQKSFWPS